MLRWEMEKINTKPQSQTLHSPGLERSPMIQQDILIQLPDMEGAWDAVEDGEFIRTLEHDEKEPPFSSTGGMENDWSLHSPSFHVPPSPSSPCSLGDVCISPPSYLSPHLSPSPEKPLQSLVKSQFTEIDCKESSSLKPKPFLSLVKSISTEISRSDPEVSQSKSDSKLNLHLWKQFTQHKGRNGDSRTAPSSPSSLSPCEPKGGFFKLELEDTRRKFSEAMQEPLSMISKIMGDENTGSPKHSQLTDSLRTKGGCGTSALSRVDLCATPQRRRRKALHTLSCYSSSSEDSSKLSSRESRYEIRAYDDVLQVVEVKQPSAAFFDCLFHEAPSPTVPDRWLFLMAVLVYSYFILPLPSYLAGMSLGLACGFFLGLLLVLLVPPRHPVHTCKSLQVPLECDVLHRRQDNCELLKGWMNEIQVYDPNTFSPSLTHSVFVTLEGCCLRLSYPRCNVPRRAAYGESLPEANFVSTRHCQLTNSKVFLLPPLLARKRVWNTKYPICITLAEGDEEEEEEEEEEGRQEDADKQTNPSRRGKSSTLYLFARTGREKEEWFQRLVAASRVREKADLSRGDSRSGVSPSPGVLQASGGSSRGSTEDIPARLQQRDLASGVRDRVLLDYSAYISRFITQETDSSCPSTEGSPSLSTKLPCEPAPRPKSHTAWVNALVGRIFWDFLCEKYWAHQVANKIQKKLSKIRLPYFMNELTLSELDMGTCTPQVTDTSRPYVDHRGLWVELELVYTGSLQMTLQTKMNLSKLGKESGLETDTIPEAGSAIPRSRCYVLADSDEESSSAGSSDEDETPLSELQGWLGDKGNIPNVDGHSSGRTSRKILKFVDKIAKSKYFQRATENEYIRKKMEEVSNTPLLLTVEVQELSGTLAVNIPPPPTDRIWYSFCTPPRLDLRVRPKLGEREVTLTHITEWIEKKLQDEFQKVFVMPNMDDLYLSLMTSGLENHPTCQSSVDTGQESVDG